MRRKIKILLSAILLIVALIPNAAFNSPLASADTSGSWASPKLIDNSLGRRIDSISCISSSFCMAIDTEGYAIKYDGSSWSVPELIDTNANGGLSSISCVSTSFCIAADQS